MASTLSLPGALLRSPGSTYGKAAGMGVIAGMRSMLAPALVSRYYTKTRPAGLVDSPLHFIDSPKTAAIFTVLAGGELIGDKLPNAPARTDPGALTGRVGSGVLCGAAMAQADGKPVVLGALAGSLGALVGAYAFYKLRHWLTQEKGLPDLVIALAEDALAIGGGLLILKTDQPAAPGRTM